MTATNAGGSAETVTAALVDHLCAAGGQGRARRGDLRPRQRRPDRGGGADFTGENLSFAVTGAGATIDAKTGLVSIPTDKAVQATVTVTATNSGGSATLELPGDRRGRGHPLRARGRGRRDRRPRSGGPSGQETWFTPVVRFPGLAGETVHAIEWTTSARTGPGQPVRGRHQGRRPATSSTCATRRRTRRARARGSTTASTSATRRRTRPALTAAGRLQRLAARTRPPARAAALPLAAHRGRPVSGRAGSRCRRLPRRSSAPGPQCGAVRQTISAARARRTSRHRPDRRRTRLVWWGLDMNTRSTDDVGDWYDSPPLRGKRDPGEQRRNRPGCRPILSSSRAASRSVSRAGTPRPASTSRPTAARLHPRPAARRHPGLGRERERSDAGLALHAVPLPRGAGRHARDPRWYAFQRKVPKGEAALDGTLWRSPDGGRTWARRRGLTVAKFGQKLLRPAPGDERRFLPRRRQRLFRSTNEGTSWTKVATARGPVLIDANRAAGEVWACVDGDGALPLRIPRRDRAREEDRLRHPDLRDLAPRPQAHPDRRGEHARSGWSKRLHRRRRELDDVVDAALPGPARATSTP